MTDPTPTPATTPQPVCPHMWAVSAPFGDTHHSHWCDRRAGHGDDEPHRCGWCGTTDPPPQEATDG